MTGRRNIAKEAAARRASMAAHVSASFDRSGKPFTCDASLTYDDAMMTLANGLAYAAILDGLAFGNSNSRRDTRHVAGLVLSDAARLQSAQYLARRDAAKVAA
jgi:hypothetical protein